MHNNHYIEMDAGNGEIPFYNPEHRLGFPHQRKSFRKRLVWGVILLAFLGLIWYALRFIPMFYITEVKMDSTGGFTGVPSRITTLMNSHKGESLFSIDSHALELELEKSAVVVQAQVHKLFPTVLCAQLVIESPKAIVAAVDDDDKVISIYLAKDNELKEMPFEDFILFGNRVFVVQVSPSYAQYLVKYGLDSGIREVVRLAGDMGQSTDGNYNLITKIKYDNNSSNNFGRMVLYLPSCNAQLWIREPVESAHLHDAIQLILLENGKDGTRNIALRGERRYDLYATSLVGRQ
ncbi:MAG: hypothetical protein AB9828_09425 [Sphaerochaetaceae bacterium]